MTAPNSPFKITDSPDSLLDWFQLYSKQFTWAAVAIFVIAAGGWFYIRSQNLKAERAEKAFFEAQRPVVSGNLPLGESDLRKMVTRYDGTTAAMQARLLLAQVMYEQGKVQQGIDELKQAEDEISDSEEFGSSVHLVLAAGLEQLKKLKEAGQQYEKAAAVARFDADRQRYETLAASAYLDGGDTAKAKELWTKLGADSKGTVAGEARVRLGELVAEPQPAS